MKSIVLIAHNLRSTHNVGSLLRTAEGLGVDTVYLTGYSPYPLGTEDDRLPHIAQKLHKQIDKTALNAQNTIHWEHAPTIETVLHDLKERGYTVAALEQSDSAVSLPNYQAPQNIALIVGREVEGIEPEVLSQCDTILEIPMFGEKESFNVVQAAAMALYHFRFSP
jgi:23S rRNA (guanosine2251-2'-O)-methyltransferase